MIETIMASVGWVIWAGIALFVIGLVSFLSAYFWTIGQYRGWQFIQERMKKSTEVTNHGT
ncbi:hypothetical protein LCGC14_1057190 [marine sediment metagenome]|uniref:Uncharacterized protein n=1 Tax=marine sediment metagenome TaxID=412755 RepID=A0A0F9N911_9ZZZZ